MGSGATSKQRRVDVSPAEASGYSGKTVSSPFSEFCTAEDEVKWLRFKLSEEKKEKDLMMNTVMNRGDHQAPSSSSCADAAGKRNEQEIIWLRRMFDAEKTEKAWVMARIEGLEAQLKTRSEECASLTRSLLGGRQAGRGTVPPEQPPMIPGSPAPKKVWKEDPPVPPVPPTRSVVIDPISPSKEFGPSKEALEKSPSGSPKDAFPPSPGGSLSLKERRGLKMAIGTGKEKAPLAVSTSGVVSGTNALVADSAAPLLLPAPQEAFARQVSSESQSPNSRLSTHSHNFPMEPMSPLLARRTGNKVGLGRDAPRLDAGRFASAPPSSCSPRPPLVLGEASNDGMAKRNSIILDASAKMASLEAPSSPKRRTRPEWAEPKPPKDKASGDDPAMARQVSRRSASMQQVPEDQVPEAQLASADVMLRQTSPRPSEDAVGITMSMP